MLENCVGIVEILVKTEDTLQKTKGRTVDIRQEKAYFPRGRPYRTLRGFTGMTEAQTGYTGILSNGETSMERVFQPRQELYEG